MLLWLVTTAALAVAVPTAWAQTTVVSEDGYAGFAASAAEDPALQQAVAAALTTQILDLAGDNGYGDLNPALVRTVRHVLHRQRRIPRPVRAGQPHRAPLRVHRLGASRAISRTSG